MKNITDLVPVDQAKLYRYEEVQPNGTGTGVYRYLRYAPGDLASAPTPVNRATLLALQGFEAVTTVFNANGSITETNAAGDVLTTVFNPNGSIAETLVGASGEVINKTTLFNPDGSINEEVI